MASLKFTKMEGIGNDYVYIDSTQTDIRLTPEQIQKISDRNFGIGSDGVIFIRNSKQGDFMMDMYNSDGSSSEMCGNGIRCVAKYIYDHGLTSSKNPKIETGAGILEVDLKVGSGNKVSLVSVDMGKPVLVPSQIPVVWKNEETIIDQPLEIGDKNLKFTAVSMGNPHCVIFVDDSDEFPVRGIGPLIERNFIFPKRVNVEFVTVRGKNHLYQRTWERGAGETLACGTGACAVMVAGSLTGRSGKDVQIDLKGGTLRIQWQESGNILMTGPAREIFSGEIEI
ncbi:diaminopimelate epimerase [Leptospira kirschneri]|uniref:Diaminopimelate epimerase n=1 Tax=Leptospira kirschneri str. 200802841 TaxID=1193047 RepID=A0A828YAL3_9LEPT|nr:diaminopimelate epimerase [Leptospira kirschneri]EMO76383.1 diaminopimelate epimerase [Leptospira kirschneri str. 200801925]EJO69656.1 diaminopimelate epimerase [Leptospira kirschneri serovar Grippotyphosa str. RM52]EKO53362.1 diaminopimelate epimerase [Leptospira kirschneri str. 200802841]EKP06356.1 diaminopimelate epimerase [Leptospira kirschneri str. 2008720114]EKQ85774.1 diaminopimelate epimerase [Leptospira kirschneri serovar Grippotyphosa str. Moskva]